MTRAIYTCVFAFLCLVCLNHAWGTVVGKPLAFERFIVFFVLAVIAYMRRKQCVS